MQREVKDTQAHQATHTTYGKREVVELVVTVAVGVAKVAAVVKCGGCLGFLLDKYEDTAHLENMLVHTLHPPDQHRGLRGAHRCEQAGLGC